MSDPWKGLPICTAHSSWHGGKTTIVAAASTARNAGLPAPEQANARATYRIEAASYMNAGRGFTLTVRMQLPQPPRGEKK